MLLLSYVSTRTAVRMIEWLHFCTAGHDGPALDQAEKVNAIVQSVKASLAVAKLDEAGQLFTARQLSTLL